MASERRPAQEVKLHLAYRRFPGWNLAAFGQRPGAAFATAPGVFTTLVVMFSVPLAFSFRETQAPPTTGKGSP